MDTLQFHLYFCLCVAMQTFAEQMADIWVLRNYKYQKCLSCRWRFSLSKAIKMRWTLAIQRIGNLKKRFYAGCQPGYPSRYQSVAGMLSPRRGLTVSPWCGRSILPDTLKSWYITCPGAVQLDTCRFTEPFWFTYSICEKV